MPIKLTKKYRKNNRRSRSKRGGGPCTPEKFGPFTLTKWGNIGGFGGGGCGFNIYVTKSSDFKDDSLKELWVDIDATPKITKIANSTTNIALKTPTGGGISEERLKNPATLLDIFPQGFYMNNAGSRLTNYILEKEQLTGEQLQPPYPDLYNQKAKDALAEKKKLSEPSASSSSAASSSAASSSASSSSNRSGLSAVWEVQTNPKYRNESLAKTRDPSSPFTTRQKEKERFIKIWGDNPDCTNVQFGVFKVNRWGGTPKGGCGFNIWDHTGKKFWMDVDPFFNIATGVKDESNCVFGVCAGKDDTDKNDRLFSIEPEENRTPVKTAGFFKKIFPDGYKVTEDGDLITKEEPAITATASASTSSASTSSTSSTSSASSASTSSASEVKADDNLEKMFRDKYGNPPNPLITPQAAAGAGGSKKTIKRRKPTKGIKQSKKKNQ
jgi:hypothetical protein